MNKESQALQAKGLKVTFPRLEVVGALMHSGSRYMNAEDICRFLMARKVDVGQATVYRILAQFAHAGLVARNRLGGDKTFYELISDQPPPQGHLVCTQTNDIEHVTSSKIDRLLAQVAGEMGYELTSYSLTLFATKK